MEAAEQPLLSFGPFGVSVCDGPYGVFKWQSQNVFLIELTDRCLRASRSSLVLRRPRGGASFEIPYDAIISAKLLPHPAHLGLMQVLDIIYRDAQGVREKAIAAYNQPAASAFAVLQRYAPQIGSHSASVESSAKRPERRSRSNGSVPVQPV